MGKVGEHLTALRSDVEFTRAMALDGLRSLALVDEAPTRDAEGILPRVVPVVADPLVPERDRLVEFVADLARTPSLAALLTPSAAGLAQLLDDPNPRVRLAALPLLSRLGQCAALITPALQRVALDDDDQRVRLGALLTLATLGDDVGALASSLYRHEADTLDRFIAALSLLVGSHPVTEDVLSFALTAMRERKLLLRCGDVPLVDNPRATLATAMARHPDAALRELALTRELEHLGDEQWIDDATAAAVLRLGQACSREANLRALHLVASRAFGPNGSLDLVGVLSDAGLPTDPEALQKQLGPQYPIGLPPRAAVTQKPWWRFW